MWGGRWGQEPPPQTAESQVTVGFLRKAGTDTPRGSQRSVRSSVKYVDDPNKKKKKKKKKNRCQDLFTEYSGSVCDSGKLES